MDSKSEDIRKITVIGEAINRLKPDVAFLNLFVRSDAVLLQDAARENAAAVEQVRQALLDDYSNIRDIHIHQVFMGEVRSAAGFMGTQANTARQEVIRSLLVTIPPDQELGIAIADRAIRLGCLMRDPMHAAGIPGNHNSVVFGLVEAANAKEDAISQAIGNAKDKAQHLASFMGKNIGAIDHVSILEFHISFEAMRHRHAALSRVKYLSNYADRIEIPAKVSVAFNLTD